MKRVALGVVALFIARNTPIPRFYPNETPWSGPVAIEYSKKPFRSSALFDVAESVREAYATVRHVPLKEQVMIFENVELHNVAEIRSVGGGVRLQRVPEVVRSALNEGAQMRVLQPDNCEIRFVSEAPESYVTLSSEGETDVTVFYGAFDTRERCVLGPQPTRLRVGVEDRLQRVDRRWWQDQPFSPHVRRIVFGGRRREPVILHSIEGEAIRPPRAEELPKIRYLAYGTSITHGFDCEGPHLSYVAQTAWHLGADLINLGVGGACHCETAFADHIATRRDWDIASLVLSVNMHGFAMDEFRERVRYMVNVVAGADTSRPVACITLYPYFRDFGLSDADVAYGGTAEEYRQVLRDVVAECPHPNATVIEGGEMLRNIGGLTVDLIHPSDNAMIEMGRNLAARIKPLLPPQADRT